MPKKYSKYEYLYDFVALECAQAKSLDTDGNPGESNVFSSVDNLCARQNQAGPGKRQKPISNVTAAKESLASVDSLAGRRVQGVLLCAPRRAASF